ncbi:Nucleoporin SEH1 [Yarrowia sp. C11]|nr:Nucleoporin SEH1 [Yarrowia sp. E02]KAG5372653.1 Nucleoporin SEH1 [Yarrowia sp. C11]
MKPFNTGHEELVHDVAYDFYGRRIATCSSDTSVKVFDRNDSTGEWDISDSWKAHDASIIKVCWANPEFGKVLATCSHDSTIKVWEENIREKQNSGKRWKRVATITDHKGPIYDLAFSPSHCGLKLASISTDGQFKIHEALDPNAIGSWTNIFETNTLSSAPSRQLQSSFCLSWGKSRFSKEYVVACALEQSYIYQRQENGKYIQTGQLPAHGSIIRDISWAPSIGRGYQLIATACKDGLVRIFKIEEPLTEGGQLQVSLINQFDDHKGDVWRVSWNLTGTILSSAGDDGRVRLWKSTYNKEFQCVGIVSAEQKHDAIED